MMCASCDRLDTSAYGLVVITLVSVIALAVITILSINTPRDSLQTTQIWIKYLALHTPAIVPSGHVLRNAGYAGVAIDRRHSPHLPLMGFSLENLMVGRLTPERGDIPLKE